MMNNKLQIGDRHYKKCFALFPKRIQDNKVKIIVFRTYYKIYEFDRVWTVGSNGENYITESWKLIKETTDLYKNRDLINPLK